MTMMLQVTDRDSTVIGQVPARVGLRTSIGTVSRFTDKTVWTVGRRSGNETMHRRSDGPLPSVPRGWAGRDFIPFAKKESAVKTATTAASPSKAGETAVSATHVLKALDALREQYRKEGMTEPMIYSGISASPAQAVTHLMAAPEVADRLAALIGQMLAAR